MGFTPKRLRHRIHAAMERVETHEERPPWKRHPSRVTLTLAIFGDLSPRVARWVRNHLVLCTVCVERKERMERTMKQPVPRRQIDRTLRRLNRLMPEDAGR